MSRIAATRRNVVARVAAEGGLRLGGLLMAMLIGRKLGLEAFGVHAYVAAACGLATVGADFGLRLLIVREGASFGAAAGPWMAQAFWLRQALALFSVSLLLCLSPWLSVDPMLLALGGAWIMLFAAADSIGGWALGLGEPEYEAAGAWIQRGGAVALAAVLLLAGLGLRGVWLGQALGAAAALIWMLSARKLPRPRLIVPPKLAQWRTLFKTALPFGLASFAAMLQTRILWFQLEHWHGKAALALLVAASKFFELGQALPALAMSAAFPALAQALAHDREAAHRGATRLARLIAGLLLPLAVALAWRARPVLELFGRDFGASEAALPPLMLALLLSGWNFLLVAVLQAADDAWAWLAGFMVSALLSLGLGWALLAQGDFVTAAWIQAGLELWLLLFFLWRLRRRHLFSLGWTALLPRTAAAAALGSLVALELPGLAGALGGALSAAVLAYALGLVKREDLELLRAKVKPA